MSSPRARRTALLALTAVTLGFVALAERPALAATPSSTYSLVFQDNFDGTSLDTSAWQYRTDVKANSSQRASNVSVSGGNLVITVKKESDRGEEYTGGGVVSRRPLRYGYYETRARTTASSGWHTAFWAMAGDGSTTFPPEQRTEIDGFEINSNKPTRLTNNIYRWAGNGESAAPRSTSGEYEAGFDTSAGWHRYGFDWNELRVNFYIDDVLTATLEHPTSSVEHDYLAIWLTSIATEAAEPLDDATLPSTVLFDYIRYYQKDYYVDDSGPADYGYDEVSGPWSTSSEPGFTTGTTSRVACGAASVTWRPTLQGTRAFTVYAYRIATANADPAARYQVTHSGGIRSITVDQTTGGRGWVSLGTYTFTAGNSGVVRATRGSGCLRADAIKLVPT